jgi:cytochrome c-type biogenesis protein CcmE
MRQNRNIYELSLSFYAKPHDCADTIDDDRIQFAVYVVSTNDAELENVAEASWQKPANAAVAAPAASKRIRFAIVGVVLLGAVAFLIFSGTANGGRYFITVNEVLSRPELVNKPVKMTGAVIGDSIRFDADTRTIHFTVANITDDMKELETEGGLARALHLAVNNPKAKRVEVVVPNQAMPDLLKDEAQAIVTGKLGNDDVFVAEELLLKCPSKYTSDLPQQAKPQ